MLFINNSPKPWDGNAHSEESLLIQSKGGYGTAICISRYGPMLRRMFRRVVLQERRRLRSLLNGCDLFDEIVCEGEEVPFCDRFVEPKVLVAHFRHRGVPIPYIHASGEPHLILEAPPPKIGFMYLGSDLKSDVWVRNLDLDAFEPLASIGTVYCLQKYGGLNKKQVRNWFVDLDDKMSDWLETAHLVAQMDYVITADTSMAHLAGAMGKATYVLVPRPRASPYLRETESGFYPNVMTVVRRNGSEECLREVLRLMGNLQ